MKVITTLVLFVAILKGYESQQVYYQPVQVLIPTINGSWASNHTVYNNTNYNRPPNVQSNYPYYPNNRTYNNSYNNGSQDGHLILGVIKPYDLLLYNQEFTKTSRWYTYREKIIEYPKDLPASYSRNFRHDTISAIRIYNKFLDGHGAKATIENGGIGRHYVKIRIVSPFRKGLRYVVQIYGR